MILMPCHEPASPSMISKGTVTSYGRFNNDTQNATALRQRSSTSLVLRSWTSGTPKKPKPRSSWARRSRPKESSLY